MPPRTRKTEDAGPTAAQAAAAEAGLDQPTEGVPDGMVKVTFRDADLIVAGPVKAAASAKIRVAYASGDDGRFLQALLGEQTSRQFERLLDDDDDYTEVLTEFFEAYGKATGQGNS